MAVRAADRACRWGKVGYDGCFGVEVFAEELTGTPNREAALTVKAAVDEIVARALGG